MKQTLIRWETTEWKPLVITPSRLAVVVVVGLLVCVLAREIPAAYYNRNAGFGEFTGPDGVYHRAKTIWDWLELVVVPSMLAVIALLYSVSQKNRELTLVECRADTDRAIAAERLHDANLQAYFEKITDLVLVSQLRASDQEADIRFIARATTLATLRGLDNVRKGKLLRFLYESRLVDSMDLPESTIGLHHADLARAELVGADLSGASLEMVDFSSANLRNANLKGAHLEWANLRHAKLVGADLRGASLANADLRCADLAGANLDGATLDSAQLECGKLVS